MSLSMRARSSTSRFTQRRGQDRISDRACFGKGHPFRKQNACSIRIAHDQMARTSVLFVANNEHGLADERVERVADHHLKRQTPGIMSSRRGKAPTSVGSNRHAHPLDPPG